MARSISFVIEGDVDTLITITEEPDGTLRFDIEVLGSALLGDLRALFFDLQGLTADDTLSVSSVAGFEGDITDLATDEASVFTLGDDANVEGSIANKLGKFDVGIEFGTSGIGADDIQSTSFILSSSSGDLSLNMLDLSDFAIRYTSVGVFGGGRGKSAKIGDQSNGVADNDVLNVDENTMDSVDLLANDTNGATNTVTAVFDAAGDFTPVAGGFEREVVVDGRVLGVLSVSALGIALFDANGTNVDELGHDAIAEYNFSYTTTAPDGSLATADVDLDVFGVNDTPVAEDVSVGIGEDDFSVSGSFVASDIDVGDLLRFEILGAPTDTFGNLFGSVVNNGNGTFTFKPGDDFQFLADGETRDVTFSYEAIDDSGSTNDTSPAKTVTVTVSGANDTPVAEDVSASIGEDDFSVNGSFVASDIDVTDVLSFQILGAPTDSFGNQYGSVVNNGNGTFTFKPGDQFQFLEAGETRDVTFSYVAIDDSGTLTDTSAAQTVTVTVAGAFDAPIVLTDELLFVSLDQSIFGTGPALVVDLEDLLGPDSFIGLMWDETFGTTFINSDTFSGDALETILQGIEDVAGFFVDIGCGIVNFFGGDCSTEVNIPDSITTPSVGVSGSTDGKIGLQPFFFLTSGGVDTSVPVDVFFTTPKQVEPGETFDITSAFSIDGGATFMTQSPGVSFGVDFIFDAFANVDLNFGSSSFGDANSFNLVNLDINETFNIFSFSTADEFLFDLAGFGTLEVNFPNIMTTGSLIDADTLTSSGEDDVAVLTIDIDALVSAIPGVPPFGFDVGEGLTFDVLGETLNLISFEATFDLLAVNLIATLSAIQNFTLDIEDLPLMALFEDGSTISGLSLGDTLTVLTPTESAFDADVDGDADGLIDFDITIDMDAVLRDLTTLGFNLSLFTGLLSLTGGITSDFFDGPSFSLFDGDGFLLSNTFELFDTDTFATLFDETFALEGFNQETFLGEFDVA